MTTALPKHPSMIYPPQHRRAGLAVEAVGIVAGRPVWPIMGGAEPGDGGTAGNGGDGGKNDDGGDGDGGNGEEGAPVERGRTYTSEDVSRLIEDRVGKLTRKHKTEIDQAREDAGKNETERYKVEAERAAERAERAGKTAGPQVAEALAQVAAIAAGGRADRAKAIVRQADLDGVVEFDGDGFNVDEAKVSEVIEKVLGEYPEWKAEPGSGDGEAGKGSGEGGDAGGEGRKHSASGGDLSGGASGGDHSLDDFKRLNMAERSKLKADDPEQYRKLADAEVDARRAGRRA